MPAVESAPAGPRIVYMPSSPLLAGVGEGTPAAQPASAPNDTPQAPPAPTGATAVPASAVVPEGQPGSQALSQGRAGVSLLQRLAGLIPLAAGIAQIVVGFMITKGTIPLVAVPLLKSLPPFIVGALVSATAMGPVTAGLGKLLGKT